MIEGSLLPPNATAQERAIEAAIARMVDVPVPIGDLWSPEKCPAELLPWLAWAFGVDEWETDWPEEAKRAAIRDSVAIHRKKGTVWAIRRVLRNAGHGDATIFEGDSNTSYDGTFAHDDARTHGETEGWARYSILTDKPINAADGAKIRALLESVAPVRCELQGMQFDDGLLYDEQAEYDGTYTYGEI